MTLRITLPLGKKDNIKNLVFSILINESPLKIIELTNFIRKRYGKSVTFQAVRKAILELVSEEILIKEKNSFLINRSWVIQSKKTIDNLYETITKEKTTPHDIDSIRGEVSVFTFDCLNDLMKFWEGIIDDWFNNFKKGDLNINCWQGAHGWEVLLHLEAEKKIMGQLKKKGIKSYAVSTGSTKLDRDLWKFYESIGIKTRLYPSSKYFDRTYYVGTYGETIVQAHYPEKILKLLDDFFIKTKNINSLNLTKLSDIVNMKIKVSLTVIKNISMAKQINKSIISQIE